MEIDSETKLELIEKAERFAVEYNPNYWGSKQPPEQMRFVNACKIIQSLTGLIINLLEEDDLCG